MTSVEYWQANAFVFLVLFVLTYGQSRYWKARAITVEKEYKNDGWVNEAKFWRRHFDKDSAEWVEESC